MRKLTVLLITLALMLMVVTGLWTGTAQETGDSNNEATALAIYMATYAMIPTCELSPMTNVNVSMGPCAVPDWYGQEPTAEATAPSNEMPAGWEDGWLYRLAAGA